MSKRTKIIIICSVVAILVSGIVFLFLRGKKTIAPLPSPTPITLTRPTISPSLGRVEMGNTLAGIELDFNMPVDPSSVIATSDPSIELIATSRKDFPNKVILSPQSPWKAGNYTIKISAGIRSLDGTSVFNQELTLRYTVVDVSMNINVNPKIQIPSSEF